MWLVINLAPFEAACGPLSPMSVEESGAEPIMHHKDAIRNRPLMNPNAFVFFFSRRGPGPISRCRQHTVLTAQIKNWNQNRYQEFWPRAAQTKVTKHDEMLWRQQHSFCVARALVLLENSQPCSVELSHDFWCRALIIWLMQPDWRDGAPVIMEWKNIPTAKHRCEESLNRFDSAAK